MQAEARAVPEAASAMTVREAIGQRRAVRAFKPDAVSDKDVRALLGLAVRAPTALHAEPWAFVVIQDRALLKRYSDLAKSTWSSQHDGARGVGAPQHQTEALAAALIAHPEFNIFYDAGTLVVICARASGPFVAADCWLAAENLMLGACTMGLGTCPIGFAVPVLNRAEVKAELGIPAEGIAVAPIIVGVPSGDPPPSTRKDPEILCWRRTTREDATRPQTEARP
jgi:nitroreductase